MARRIPATLLAIILSLVTLTSGCRPPIDDKVVASDLAELDKWIAAYDRAGTSSYWTAETSSLFFGIWYLKSGKSYEGPEDMRKRIQAGERIDRWEGTFKAGTEFYTLDELSPASMEARMVANFPNWDAPQKTKDRAVVLLREHPNWFVGDAQNVAQRVPWYGMSKDMIQVMMGGKPTRQRATATYDAWWYSLGKDKRAFFVFNHPSSDDGVLFYFIMDK